MRVERRRRFGVVAVMAAAVAVACGDDGPTEPRVPLEELVGEYATVQLSFDPQGSAPAANVLGTLIDDGEAPTLNIDLVGTFQVLFRDPVSGSYRTPGGDARPTVEGVELRFTSQSQADEFLLPRTVPLTRNPDTGVLSFSGQVEVSRERLLELFPVLYADEQFQHPTPGTLTVRFEPGETTS